MEVSGVVRNLPVEVISLCSADGEIRPLRFRMEDDAHQLLRVDIDEVISVKPIQYVGIEAQIFLCKAMVKGKQWMFELKYTIRTHSWCLFRRVY
jgi:hypothetical protein